MKNCNFVTSNDDGGLGVDSRLELFVSAGDVFFLEAGSFGSSIGAFTLTATRDDVDNFLATNGSIFLSQEGYGSIFGEIERTGDRDLFAITSQLTGTLVIQQNDADPGFFDSVLRIFDSSGKLSLFPMMTSTESTARSRSASVQANNSSSRPALSMPLGFTRWPCREISVIRVSRRHLSRSQQPVGHPYLVT